jgi:hypothetical protein
MGNRLGVCILFFAVLTMTLGPLESYALTKTQDYQINIDQDQCLFEILRSPITKHRYPDLLHDNFNNKNYKMLKEMDKFCACSVKSRKEELKQKKIDKMSWRFRDKKEGLSKEDQCALTELSDRSMNLIFEVIVASRFRMHIEEALDSRMTKGMRIIASDLSIQDQMICVESKILQTCTRIKSLRSTYECIERTTSDPTKMDKLSIRCPRLIEKTNYRLARDDLSI